MTEQPVREAHARAASADTASADNDRSPDSHGETSPVRDRLRQLWARYSTPLALLLLLGFSAYELASHARLVQLSGQLVGTTLASDDLQAVSWAATGLGVALLLIVLRGLMKWFKVPYKDLLLLFIAVIAAVLFYLAQNHLLEKYLIKPFDGEERFRALQLLEIKEALISGDLAFADEAAPLTLEQPEHLTFLAVLGPLALGSDSLFERLEQHEGTLIEARLRRQYAVEFPTVYDRYQAARADIREWYAGYERASARHRERHANAAADAELLWVEAQNALNERWRNYQQAHADYQEDSARRAEVIGALVSELVERNRECHRRYGTEAAQRRHCDPLVREYRQRIGQYVAGNPEVADFCEEARSRGWRRIFDGIGGNTRLSCPAARNRLVEEIYRRNADYFAQNNGGYQPGIGSRTEFDYDRATFAWLREGFAGHGIDLPSSWQGDVHTYSQVAAAALRERADRDWPRLLRSELADATLGRGLSYAEFTASTPAQQRLQQALGGYYHGRTSPDLNQRQFQQQVADPAFARALAAEKQNYQRAATELAEGGARAEVGREYVRALLTLPLGLVVSLSLLVVSAIAVVDVALKLLLTKWLRRRAVTIRTGTMLALAALAWYGPFLLLPYDMEAIAGLSHLYQQAQSTLPPNVLMALEWFLRVEQLIHPLGLRLSEAFAAIGL